MDDCRTDPTRRMDDVLVLHRTVIPQEECLLRLLGRPARVVRLHAHMTIPMAILVVAPYRLVEAQRHLWRLWAVSLFPNPHMLLATLTGNRRMTQTSWWIVTMDPPQMTPTCPTLMPCPAEVKMEWSMRVCPGWSSPSQTPGLDRPMLEVGSMRHSTRNQGPAVLGMLAHQTSLPVSSSISPAVIVRARSNRMTWDTVAILLTTPTNEQAATVI